MLDEPLEYAKVKGHATELVKIERSCVSRSAMIYGTPDVG